jgi:biopolymer transport protein ExbD
MPLKTNFDEQPSMNLTPMIDIVFLLIIFFMVGTRFVEMERNIAVQVPAVRDAQTLSPPPERRVINVYRDGQISLDRQPVTLDQLTSELTIGRQQYAELGVIVRGDAEGTFQNVASVLNACRQAGIAEMGISVRMASHR